MKCKFKSIPISAAIGLCWVLMTPFGLHAAETLTLAQALQIALKKNPTLAASRSEMDASRARVTQATASLYPQLNASAGYDHTWSDTGSSSLKTSSSDSVDAYSTGLSVTQYLFDFGKTPAQIEKSSQSLKSAEENFKTVKKTLVRDVKQAYFEILKNRQWVNVDLESLEFRKQQLAQARALYRQGLRPRIDVTRGEVEVSQTQLKLVTARHGLKEAFIAMEKLLGGPPVPGAYALAEEAPPIQPAPALAGLIARALEERPELAGLKAQVKAAQADLLSLKRSAAPSLNAKGAYAYSGDELPLEDHRWQLGMNLSWPLFSGFRRTGQVYESKAEVGRLNAQIDSRRLAVTEEVSRAYLQMKTAEASIAAAETVLRQARENLAIARGRYQAGVSDTIELSDAQVLYTESQNALIQAVYVRQQALAGLEFAVGGPL